jgi:Xaa-Pro aminopeptidase
MNTDNKMEKRIQKLWQLIEPNPDGMLITSPENVRYLSGFSGTEGTLIICRKEGIFLTDGRYTTQAKEQVRNFTPITYKEKWNKIGRIIKKLRIKTLGFESRNLSVALQHELGKAAPSITLKPYSEALDMLRAVKDAAEIKILQKAARIASESLREVVAFIKPGVREIEIAAELEYRMRKKAGEAIAFHTIVASGFRSALPHGIASDKKIKKGEFVIIDYGLIYQGYCSDETCTFVVGPPTKKQKNIYETVKKAHDLAIKAVAPGKSLKEIDAVARTRINKSGYGRYFSHGTGHGIGLCVHEPPVVSFRSNGKIKKGMVFTIEPGIYLPKWGGVRIEDTVVVKPGGCERITLSDKSLKSVDI